MADDRDDDENVVPFPRFEVELEEDTLREADLRTAMSYFADHYDRVAVVAYDAQEDRLDIVETIGDVVELYELLQQGAANVALEAIENALGGTKH